MSLLADMCEGMLLYIDWLDANSFFTSRLLLRHDDSTHRLPDSVSSVSY